MVAVQLVERTLFLMEAGYRGALFPRWRWTTPYCLMGYVSALSWAILAETRSPDVSLAETDPRVSVKLPS